MTQQITTFITFEKGGKEAVEMYCKIFKRSKIDHVMTMPGSDQLLHASFSLDGQQFMAMDGGEHFRSKIDEGISLFVSCGNQDEVDYYWNAFLENGGKESQCGWLVDKFGVSWQIIPTRLGELMGDPDPAKSGHVMAALLKMRKIIIADLEKAYKGE